MNHINDFTNYLKAKRMSDKTIKDYTSNVTKMLNFINKSDEDITYTDLLNWLASINHLSSATVQQRIVSVRRYFSVLKKLGLIDNNPAEELESIKVNNKQKVVLSNTEMRALIDSAKNIRDKAIISLLSHSAMRVGELINLKVSDIENDAFVIHGKGDKERVVYLDDETKRYIHAYLDVRKNGCNNLFVGNQGNPMNEQCISDMLKVTARRTGIINNPDRVAPHLLRASRATALDEAGVSVSVIKEVLGHASIQTTAIYLKTNPARVSSAMALGI